jgi:hypothetical protein
MRRARRSAITLLAAACGVGLMAACGSHTKTVSVSGAPPVTQATVPRTASTTTSSPPAQSTQTSTSGAPPGGTTRTAPAPAFTHQQNGTEGLSSARAVVAARGFTASNVSDYHPNQTLRLLIGTRTGSGDGYDQRAFFFVNGRFIGTDAGEPSATLRVLSQNDTEVALAYPLYRQRDPLCCPSGGQARVRFQLNNGRLTALDPIPPVNSASGLSRH